MSKIAVITGANSGIGKETVKGLLKEGFKVIMICRDTEKSQNTLYDLENKFDKNFIKMIVADLTIKDQIKAAGKEILNTEDHIDVLINNAGVYKVKQVINDEKIETNMAVHYFAMARLTKILLPLLKKSKQGRIINLTSELFKQGKINDSFPLSYKKYNAKKAYNNSKLAVVLYTQRLAGILKDTNLTVNCVHPGVVGTDIFRDYPDFFMKIFKKMLSTPEEGAKPSIKLAVDPELDSQSGLYFYMLKESTIPLKFREEELLNKIWSQTKNIVGL